MIDPLVVERARQLCERARAMGLCGGEAVPSVVLLGGVQIERR